MSTSHHHPRADSVSGLSMSEFETASSLAKQDWTEDPEARAEPVDPALLARRRQLRSWVGRGMLTLAFFTVAALLVRGTGERRSGVETPALIPAPINVNVAAAVVPDFAPAPIARDAALVALPSTPSTERVKHTEHAKPATHSTALVATQLRKPTRRPHPSVPVAAAPKRKSVLMPMPF